MKYKLIIDKNAEEEIIAVVHAPSSLTQQIENLVRSFSGADSIMGYRDDEMRKLLFEEIECITILDRKVIAIDTKGNRYSLKDRLRDLEAILPSLFSQLSLLSWLSKFLTSLYLIHSFLLRKRFNIYFN